MNKKGESKFPRGIGRIEELIRIVEGSADPAARDHVRELARVILDLHGMGLCKMVEFIAQAGEPGRAILDRCTRDDLVRSLLLLHDLHPQGQEARAQQVLAQLQPLLLQHGADLKLVGVADGLGSTTGLGWEPRNAAASGIKPSCRGRYLGSDARR